MPLRLLRLAAHPTAVAAAFRQVVHALAARWTAAGKWNGWTRNSTSTRCVPSVPYRTAFALETAQIGGKKAAVAAGPLRQQQRLHGPGWLRTEGQLLQTIDTAFITPQALPDYEGGPFSSWRHLGVGAGLPGFTAGRGPVPAHEGWCVFCGSLYPTLRKPDFTLELFTSLNALT